MRTETLAVVFTDIKGYTAATSKQSHQEQARILRRIERLVAPVVPAFGEPEAPELNTQPYSPLKSIWPNYIRPDLFADISDFQIGIATKSHDVSGDYRLDAGLRYSSDTNYFALRLGAQAKTLGTQFTRYPVSYTTDVDQIVDESRHEARLFWRPLKSISRF